MNKDTFQKYKRETHLNGGERILKVTKMEVIFDPNNSEHVFIADLLFTDITKMSVAEKAWLAAQKRALTIQFKLEVPFFDLKSMIQSKIMNWAVEYHQERKSRLHSVPSSTKVAQVLSK